MSLKESQAYRKSPKAVRIIFSLTTFRSSPSYNQSAVSWSHKSVDLVVADGVWREHQFEHHSKRTEETELEDVIMSVYNRHPSSQAECEKSGTRLTHVPPFRIDFMGESGKGRLTGVQPNLSYFAGRRSPPVLSSEHNRHIGYQGDEAQDSRLIYGIK